MAITGCWAELGTMPQATDQPGSGHWRRDPVGDRGRQHLQRDLLRRPGELE